MVRSSGRTFLTTASQSEGISESDYKTYPFAPYRGYKENLDRAFPSVAHPMGVLSSLICSSLPLFIPILCDPNNSDEGDSTEYCQR